MLRYAALVHDFGKIGIKDSVLGKPGRLTDEEYTEMKKHPKFTRDILSRIQFAKEFRDIPVIASCHHEKMDGTGYPYGLKGEQIPALSRIIAVADVFDAVTSHRPYRAPMSTQEAIKILKDSAGSHLDSDMVKAFDKFIKSRKYVTYAMEEDPLYQNSHESGAVSDDKKTVSK